MPKKISRRTLLKRFPDFPTTNRRTEDSNFPECVASYIISVKSTSVKGHAKALAHETAELFKLMKLNSVFILGDSTIPWLYQQNSYRPVNDALNYLRCLNISAKFNGGFEIEITELPIFLQHLFWLVRYHTSLPYFYIIDQEFNFLISLCQYGNLHVYILNKAADLLISEDIETTNLIQLNEC